jgi:three-Cys-motif partner protein
MGKRSKSIADKNKTKASKPGNKTKKFFAEQKEQSLVKSRIVSKYFVAWSQVMIHNRKSYGMFEKLAYIDLFCGPGRYDDGSKSTPISVLEHAIANPDLANMLATMFNDMDEDNVKSLQAEINALPRLDSLKHKPEFFCAEVNKDVAEMFAKVKLCPTFSFVDPFGYKGLSAAFIKSIIKDWGCDCVFFFNYGRINAGISNHMVASHMDSLFGNERAEKMRGYVKNKSSRQREAFILEELAQALKEMGATYVLPFRFKKNGARTSHALIFVTKHMLGYGIMKEIMAAESSTDDQGVPSFSYSPADAQTPFLFSMAQPIKALKAELLCKFAGQTKTMKEIYTEHHVDTPFIAKNYKKVLNELEAEGLIEASPPANNRKVQNGERTFGDKVKVSFPAVRRGS